MNGLRTMSYSLEYTIEMISMLITMNGKKTTSSSDVTFSHFVLLDIYPEDNSQSRLSLNTLPLYVCLCIYVHINMWTLIWLCTCINEQIGLHTLLVALTVSDICLQQTFMSTLCQQQGDCGTCTVNMLHQTCNMQEEMLCQWHEIMTVFRA